MRPQTSSSIFRTGCGKRAVKHSRKTVTILAESGTRPQIPICFLLPFVVTRPVTIQEVSIAVESRDANRVFEKPLSKRRLHLSIYVPLLQIVEVNGLILPRNRLGNGLGSITMLISVETCGL